MSRDHATSHRPWGARLGLLACAALLALSACGPGVGGSGTGPDLAAFGATASPICNAPFAQALGCTAGATAPEQPGGTAALQFVDDVNGSQVVATLRGADIELDLRCPRLNFFGTWGTGANGVSRYFGSYSRAAVLPLSAAQLAVAADSTGTGLVVQLLDATGAALTAPVRLRPAAGTVQATAQGCP
jgi:hypothetical protein